jgi:hypothetical protein
VKQPSRNAVRRRIRIAMEKTEMGVKTKGTQMYVRIQNSNGYSMVQVGCPTGITGLGGAASKIDDTCLDDEEMQYEPGMPDPGQITVNLNFDPSKVSHQELWDLFNSQEKVPWAIGWPDGKDIPPTVDMSGTITYPSTRTFTSFDGYIADLPLDFAKNALVTSQMQVQRSGPRTMHYKV